MRKRNIPLNNREYDMVSLDHKVQTLTRVHTNFAGGVGGKMVLKG
jgi:hypothetical protein